MRTQKEISKRGKENVELEIVELAIMDFINICLTYCVHSYLSSFQIPSYTIQIGGEKTNDG